MRTFLTITICLFFSFSINAQHSCGTQMPADPVAFESQMQASMAGFARSAGVQWLPLRAQVIRDDCGLGGISREDLDVALRICNASFEPHGIQFYWCGSPNYIDNSSHYYWHSQNTPWFVPQYATWQVIDVFMPYDITHAALGNLGGYASIGGNDRDYVFVASRFSTSVGEILAHELGHQLSLYHTHETGFGVELVDGSNCSTAGDLVCDTEASPILSGLVGLDCIYTGTGSDANGDVYAPTTDNVMSYSIALCRSVLTPGQATRMHANIPMGHSQLSCTISADNDLCADAHELQVYEECTPVVGTVNNVNTSSLPTPSCDNSAGDPLCSLVSDRKDVFYRFTAVATDMHVHVRPHADLRPLVIAYTGSNCSALTELACAAPDSVGATTELILNGLTLGEEYYLRVYHGCQSSNLSNGDFMICVSYDAPPVHNDIQVTHLGSWGLHFYPGDSMTVFSGQKYSGNQDTLALAPSKLNIYLNYSDSCDLDSAILIHSEEMSIGIDSSFVYSSFKYGIPANLAPGKYTLVALANADSAVMENGSYYNNTCCHRFEVRGPYVAPTPPDSITASITATCYGIQDSIVLIAHGGDPGTDGILRWGQSCPSVHFASGFDTLAWQVYFGQSFSAWYYSPSTFTNSACATVSIGTLDVPNAYNDTSVTMCNNDYPVSMYWWSGGPLNLDAEWYHNGVQPTTNPAQFDPSLYPPGPSQVWYVIPGNACGAADTAFFDIDIQPTPYAGEDSTTYICLNAAPTDLFQFLPGADTGGVWVNGPAGGIYYADSTNGFQFQYQTTLGQCSAQATVSVQNHGVPSPPSWIQGDTVIITGSNQTYTSATLGAALGYIWSVTPNDWIGSSSTSTIDFTPTGSLPAELCVQVIAWNGCISEPNCYTIWADGTTSISEGQNETFDVFPNPSEGLLTIETFGRKNVSVAWTDLNGREVIVPRILADEHIIFDMSAVAKGVYICTIADGDLRVSERVVLR